MGPTWVAPYNPPRMPRRAKNRLCALLAALAPGLAGCGADSASTPNLLVILVDDVGCEALSAFADTQAQLPLPATPNIDALAQRGVRFERVWANPLCSPTRATIQTGRYGFRTGVGGVVRPDGPALPLDELTLPELFERARPGVYASAAIGKWHLGNASVGALEAPRPAGYEHFAGSLGNLVGNQSYTSWERVKDGLLERSTNYATSDAVDACLRFVAASERPWLCYLALHAAHAPLHAPPEELVARELGELSPEADPRQHTAAMIEAVDHELGRLLDGLGEELLEDTTIVFLSDNGTSPLAHGGEHDEGRAKGTLYEPGLRVPLIVAGARVSEPGRSSAALINTTDLYATLAELAGIDARANLPDARALDSVSFLPALESSAHWSARKTLYAEVFHPNGPSPSAARRAVRGPRYKLVVHEPSGARQLYDLESDPLEELDLLSHGTLSQRSQGAYSRLMRELGALLDD